ncbi:MAG: glycoside hydrolase family 2 TIM barrel-domain containing protein [Wenyingzhuangia sp.]
MTKKHILFFTAFLLLMSFNGYSQTREYRTLTEGWKFVKLDVSDAEKVAFDDTSWKNVSIPHDWAITGPFIKNGNGDTGKLPWKGEGWYRKKITVEKKQEGKRLYLIFDGIMAFPKIYINGKLAGGWDYGYNSFYLDITDYVNYGEENLLAIHANTKKHDSRWYPGGGIYRKVQLLFTNQTHVGIWGNYIITPTIKNNFAEVRVNSSITNSSSEKKEIKVVHSVINKEGMILSTKEQAHKILANKTADFETTQTISQPVLWDVNNPYLYTIKTTVFENSKLVDETEESFGFRTIKFTADDGFHLNGRRVQLKGVNLHSDHGPLGVAFNYRAMERQLEIMKSMGVNAIRNSHNVAAPELLELCDKMGLLFFNEIFDKYDHKAGITEETNFDEFAHRNIKNFVTRDRNHPSVFLWSVGNEIGDVQWNINNGFKRLHTMVNYVKKYDPTRPTTLVCDNMESAKLRHFDYYDVHSWNYGRRYRLARKLEPNKSVVISESASTLSTRGFYEFPLPKEKIDFTKSLQVSSYDLNAPWWAEIADDDFMWQQQESYIAGEFVWTGFDYLGEPTPYNNKTVKEMGFDDEQASRSSYFGIVDLVGIPKDRYYLYKSYWKPEENTTHILPHWNWKGKEGDTIPVFGYTNGDCGELFVNGKSQGSQCKKPLSEKSVERFRLMWNNVIYQPGEIKFIAYKNNQKIGEVIKKTTGTPYQLKITPDKTTLKANGEDLSYLLVEAIDTEGNPHPLANNTIKIDLQGNATIAGVGNGNPQSFEPFQSNTVKLFNGKAMIIIKSKNKPDTIKIKASSKKLKQNSVTLTVL